jgi:hypothetical protein
MYVIDTDVRGGTSGQPLSGWPRTMLGNSEGSPAVGDIDGDGQLDIVHGIGGGSAESPNTLYAFKASGEYVDGFPITLGGPVKATPFLCDMDRDGDIDIALEGWDLLIHVWDMPYPYVSENLPWRTFRGHYYRDGVYRPPSVVSVPEAAAPEAALLLALHPNPFNPSTTVRLYLPGPASGHSHIEVGIYDVQGRLVRTLHQGPVAGGWHSWVWDGRDTAGRVQASGLYFLRARSGDQTAVRKMSLIK